MINYTCGLMFSHDKQHIALIRKLKPKFLFGYLNAIGGKIEEKEDSTHALLREFEEETGVTTTIDMWRLFCRMDIQSVERPATCDFYVCFSNRVFDCRTMEEEKVEVLLVKDVWGLNIYFNLHWLIPMALDNDLVYSLSTCK